MEQIFTEIKAVPGVTGAFVYHDKRGTLGSSMPGVFRPEKLDAMGRALAKVVAAGRQAYSDIETVSLSYEEGTLIVVEVGSGAHLVILSEPTASQGLISMSLRLVLGELQDAIAAPNNGAVKKASAQADDSATPEFRVEPEAAEAALSVAGTPVEEALSLPEILASDELSPSVNLMEDALIKVIGPMGALVFADAVAAWATQVTPAANSLALLIDAVCEEISESEKRDQYRELATDGLRSLAGEEVKQ